MLGVSELNTVVQVASHERVIERENQLPSADSERLLPYLYERCQQSPCPLDTLLKEIPVPLRIFLDSTGTEKLQRCSDHQGLRQMHLLSKTTSLQEEYIELLSDF